MDLRSKLLAASSKVEIMKLVQYVSHRQEEFDLLTSLLLSQEPLVIQRAAWVMGHCVEKKPDLMKKHLKKLILNLKKTKTDTVKRHTLRSLQFLTIPPNLKGITTDICFSLLTSSAETVAVKVFSMSTLYNIVLEEPDLKNELLIAIEDQLPYESSAFKSRGSKIVEKLKNR